MIRMFRVCNGVGEKQGKKTGGEVVEKRILAEDGHR